MPTTDELESQLTAVTARVAALEAFADAIVPALRALGRRSGDSFDAHGSPQPFGPLVPDGCERADIAAAVPWRSTH